MPVRLPEGIWALVADGEKALFLHNVGDEVHPQFAVRRKEEQDNPRSGRQGADSPGRMPDTGIGQRSAMQETDWHELERHRFADDLAALLYDRAHKGRFEHIILVAEPDILGELRDKLHPEVASRTVMEVPKNLTNHPVDKIEKMLIDRASAPK